MNLIRTIILFSILQVNYYKSNAQQYGLKDSTVKIYYDGAANILDIQNSNDAKYYRIINYRNGSLNGPVKDYYKNGTPLMTGYYTANNIGKGYENGRFTWYYENGIIFQTCNYINGVLDGLYIEFYSSGKRKASVSYSMGNKYGCEYSWNENGALIQKGFFENGVSYTREECNTIDIDKLIASEKKLAFDGWNVINFSDSDWKVVNNFFYYISNSAEIKEISNPRIVTPKNDSTDLSPLIKIEGFKRLNGQYSYTYWLATNFEKDKSFEIIDKKELFSTDDPFYFSFAFKKPFQKRGSPPLNFNVDLLIKDNFSDAVIMGKFSIKYFYD